MLSIAESLVRVKAQRTVYKKDTQPQLAYFNYETNSKLSEAEEQR